MISLLVSGISNYDNIIRDPEDNFDTQLDELLGNPNEIHFIENPKTGSPNIEGLIGLIITFRTKILLQTSGYEDTNSLEVWKEGKEGNLVKKTAQGPKFYKGIFETDLQILAGNPPVLSFEKIAAIFGWTEYLELARQKRTDKFSYIKAFINKVLIIK